MDCSSSWRPAGKPLAASRPSRWHLTDRCEGAARCLLDRLARARGPAPGCRSVDGGGEGFARARTVEGRGGRSRRRTVRTSCSRVGSSSATGARAGWAGRDRAVSLSRWISSVRCRRCGSATPSQALVASCSTARLAAASRSQRRRPRQLMPGAVAVRSARTRRLRATLRVWAAAASSGSSKGPMTPSRRANCRWASSRRCRTSAGDGAVSAAGSPPRASCTASWRACRRLVLSSTGRAGESSARRALVSGRPPTRSRASG